MSANFDAFRKLGKDVAEIKALVLSQLRANDVTYTEEKAAEYLGIQVQTLRNRVARREIGFVRHGRTTVFYKAQHLDKYLEQFRVDL